MNNSTLDLPPLPLRVTNPRLPGPGRLIPIGFSILIHGMFFIYFGERIFDSASMHTRPSSIIMRLQPMTVDKTPATITSRRDEVSPRPPLPTPLTPMKSVKVLQANPLLLASQRTQVEPITAYTNASSQAVIPPAPTATKQDLTPETAAPVTPVVTPPIKPPAATIAVKTTAASMAEPSTIEQRQQTRQDYLAELIARIESHKYYPNAARQRRMEGQTMIQFSLLASGEVREISISGGPKLLRIASKTALQMAFPLPEPPDTIDFPLSIQFNMEYRLI